MLREFSSAVHTLRPVALAGTAAGEIEYPGVQRLEEVPRHRRLIGLRGPPGDRYRQAIHVADGTLVPGTKNDDGDEGFDNCATFTSTAKVMREGVLPFSITGMLIAVLISTASPPASGSTGCAGYAMPSNHAESFWREARTDQVQACIRRFGAAPSGMTGIFTPLHLAALFSGRPAVIAALLQGGADANAKLDAEAAQGATPLHVAAQMNSNPAVLEALLKGGAEPNAKAGRGATPLHVAARYRSDHVIVAVLLEGGADHNVRTAGGFTPLHVAAHFSGNPEVIKALLENGADHNATTKKGATPLHVAAQLNANPAILVALLKGGADPKAEAEGKTAFDLAGNNPKLRGSDVYRQLREAQQESTETSVTLDLTKEDYRAIQRLLNERGFEAGPEDGRWGSRSRGALRAFQAQGGLGQTGVPDTATRKALGFQETAESETRDPGDAKDDAGLRDACRVGQELEPGQGCRIPGGGEFKVESDGCVTEVPDVPGPLSMGNLSMSGSYNAKTGENTISWCIRGHLDKGKFNAGEDAEESIWRIESLPEAN